MKSAPIIHILEFQFHFSTIIIKIKIETFAEFISYGVNLSNRNGNKKESNQKHSNVANCSINWPEFIGLVSNGFLCSGDNTLFLHCEKKTVTDSYL